MLAVNVSYLAVPGLETSSVGHISSLCSILASIGCIVVGSLLASEHYTAPKEGNSVSSKTDFKVFGLYLMGYLLSDMAILCLSTVSKL